MIYDKLFIFLYIVMNRQEMQLCGAVGMNFSGNNRHC